MKFPAVQPATMYTVAGGTLVLLALAVVGHSPSWLALGLLGMSAASALAGRVLQRHRTRQAYNCASCGHHQPEPSVVVTLGGAFPDGDTTHAGVLVVWCKACAPHDALHGVLVRFATERDAAGTRYVLDSLARRGPGRVTWLSQSTLDRVRDVTGASPIESTAERAVH